MATAGHYTERTEGYRLTRTTSNISGTRVFIDGDDSFSESLPSIGDSWDSTDSELSDVLVTQIDKVKNSGDPAKHIYTIIYSNVPGSSDGIDDTQTGTDPDFLPISGSLSAEAVNVDGTKSGTLFVWNDSVAGSVDQQVFKKIVTGSFKITKRLANLSLGTWSQYNGKINSTAFQAAGTSFVIGAVLFNGVEYDEYRNNKGKRRWRVNFSFSVKSVPLFSLIAPGAFLGYGGWNYCFDSTLGKFRLVKESGTDKALYESTDLNKLISMADNP